jgi:hypothetical protein
LTEAIAIGYCGVCCDHCGMKSRIPNMAQELGRFVEAYRYGDWVPNTTQDFEFPNFMKGLKWFANWRCKGCLEEGGMPACGVRACCKNKGLRNCYSCGDFEKCGKLEYQKSTYKIDESHNRITEIGYDNWLREQREKASKGFDNIEFLQKKNR